MFKQIIADIEQNDIITIYPHVSPDGDALGCCFGMKELILGKYPNKQVYVLGKHYDGEGTYFPCFDDCSDETITNSLALSLDTADLVRVDEPRIKLAKKIIKIDHHPNVDPFGAITYVDDTKGACAEIITLIGRLMYEDKLPEAAAKWLYSGLFSDTMGFTTSSTNANSLEIGSFLASHGLNLNAIAYNFTSREIPSYKYITKVREKAEIDREFLVAIIKKEDYHAMGVSFDEAKSCVSEFARVRGLKVWSLFVETDNEADDFKYVGSLRSRDCIVNDIAANHHGGGHKVAAGCKLFSDSELEQIVEELRVRANG